MIKIYEWALSSVSLDTVSKMLPNPVQISEALHSVFHISVEPIPGAPRVHSKSFFHKSESESVTFLGTRISPELM